MTQPSLFPVEDQGLPLFHQAEDKPFAHARVEATSVEDFINRYYKKERLYDNHFPGYTQLIIDGRKEDIQRNGYAIISRHESVTGNVVAYFP